MTMNRWRSIKFQAGGIVAVGGIALTIAACGSSSSSSSSGAAPSPAPASTGSAGSSGSLGSNGPSLAINTTKGPAGNYLTGASGKAIYLWVADSNGKSVCSGACAQAWPPVIAKTTPKASGGAIAGDLGTVSRSDGSKQVTYKGHPLYYFVGDNHAGMITGQGSDEFGAKWWLVAPSGTAVTASSTGSSSGASGDSSSGASGGSPSSGSSSASSWG
jgi:predicted lipoprotein with Yx(FWY)xxD motif